ncbi:MAG TPA: ECF-type sigma factor [Steroidobacteraceae bacterium]|nr:ECF-type sigma factor [Steroidobacteraceae bacterium]
MRKIPGNWLIEIHKLESGDVTRLLAAAGGGDRAAFDRLYSAVYAELRSMAAARMRRERRALTLQPTALVNEAWLRLAAGTAAFENRGHFFFAAGESMRRILVDQARRRRADRRGGGAEHVTLSGVDFPARSGELDVLDVDEALTRLEKERPRLAQLVTLRFFAGLSIEDAAAALEISPATAKRDWSFARAWLMEELGSASSR